MSIFVFLGGSALLIFLGVAIVRVGLIGKHLGSARLVSFVKKYPEAPQPRHRQITVGIGVALLLFGAGLAILQFIVLARIK